jgi:hypothetical protein
MRIPVQGTFDVALARNMLRKKIAERGWLPSYRARAAAALTALTELVLLSQTPAVLNINMVEQGNPNVGIELVCDIHWRAAKDVWLEQARMRLTRAANEMEIDDSGTTTHIVARIWLSEDEMQWLS